MMGVGNEFFFSLFFSPDMALIYHAIHDILIMYTTILISACFCLSCEKHLQKMIKTDSLVSESIEKLKSMVLGKQKIRHAVF